MDTAVCVWWNVKIGKWVVDRSLVSYYFSIILQSYGKLYRIIIHQEYITVQNANTLKTYTNNFTKEIKLNVKTQNNCTQHRDSTSKRINTGVKLHNRPQRGNRHQTPQNIGWIYIHISNLRHFLYKKLTRTHRKKVSKETQSM